MNKKVILIFAVVCCVAGAVYVINTKLNNSENSNNSVAANQENPTESQNPDVKPAASKTFPKVETSADFKDYYSWSKSKQLQEITKVMENPHLSDETVNFLEHILQDPKQRPLTKNNIANALINQEKPLPYLHKYFIAMYDDKSQQDKWRDYSVQFLAESLRFTDDPDTVKKKLIDVATNDTSSIGATALVQIAYQHGYGRIDLPDNYNELLVKRIEAKDAPLEAKVSSLALIGKTANKENLDLLRKYATDDNASLRRTAIASLGLIGEKSDAAIIEKALQDKNGAVRLAAKAALKNLNTPKDKRTKKNMF